MQQSAAHRRGAGTGGLPARPCNTASGGPRALRGATPWRLPLPLVAALGVLATCVAVLTHPHGTWLASLSPRLAIRSSGPGSRNSRAQHPETPRPAQAHHRGAGTGPDEGGGSEGRAHHEAGAGALQATGLPGAVEERAGVEPQERSAEKGGTGMQVQVEAQQLRGMASNSTRTLLADTRPASLEREAAAGAASDEEPSRVGDSSIRRSIVRPGELGQALGRMRAGRPVVGTISNLAFSDMLRNWFLNVRKAGMADNALVAALDQQTLQFCQANGMPSILLHSDLPSTDFRRSAKTFKEMGTLKTAFVASVLEAGWDLLMSDTDTVWMRDPSHYLATSSPLGKADVMVTSDSLSHKNDVASQQRHWREGGPKDPQSWFSAATPRGREPFGSAYAGSLNTGVAFLRSTNATRRFALAWHEAMRTQGKSMGLARVWGDQHAFNELHRIRMFPIQVFEPTDGSPINNRIFWTFNATVRLAILPVAEFCNGHVFFVQQLHVRNSIEPYVVHNTFQFYYGPGKVARFRQAGLWLLDPPEYYTQGSFLSISLALPQWILDIPLGIDKHVAAMQFYYEGLRNAWAIAMITNRTLIFPSVTCFCDRHYLNLQAPCRSSGADVDPPYECPLDHFLDVAFWTADAATMAYRPSNWLALPQVPAEIKNSRRVVEVVPRAQLAGAGAEAQQGISGTALVLPAQADDRDVEARLTTPEAAAIRVLHIEQPHKAFCRFHTQSKNAYFDWKAYRRFHIEWCCLPGFRPPQWPRYKGLAITIPDMVNRTLDACQLLGT